MFIVPVEGRERSMDVAARSNKKGLRPAPRRETLPPPIRLAILLGLALGLGNCGQTAKTPIPASQDQVHSYFGSPFPAYEDSGTTIDHSANQLMLSTAASGTPAPFVGGTFTASLTGFLVVTENIISGVPDSQFQPPLVMGQPVTGSSVVEIPGVGALANLMTVNTGGMGPPTLAGAVAMAENTACPSFQTAANFLYVTVPIVKSAGVASTADYGTVGVKTQGTAVTFSASPFLVGSVSQTASAATGGCSDSFFGPITTFPLNSLGQTSFDRIAIGASGLLVDSFTSSVSAGAFGQNASSSGVIGVAAPSSPVSASAVVTANYTGYFYAPQSQITFTVPLTYDATLLASAFGNHSASSQSCSALNSSIAANHGQGSSGTVAALPSRNSLYGGEFLTTSGANLVNIPSGAQGSENCDLVIDFGVQDPNNNGLFPNAAIFVGSSFPPFSTANPWLCTGLNQGNGVPCAVSFPAVAVVAELESKFVIFVVSSSQSTPPAQLPDAFGNLAPQPVGIYLFQNSP